jgi:hypothetical protein
VVELSSSKEQVLDWLRQEIVDSETYLSNEPGSEMELRQLRMKQTLLTLVTAPETSEPQQFRAMELLDMRGQWALTRAEPPVRVVLAPGESWRPAQKTGCFTINKEPQ